MITIIHYKGGSVGTVFPSDVQWWETNSCKESGYYTSGKAHHPVPMVQHVVEILPYNVFYYESTATTELIVFMAQRFVDDYEFDPNSSDPLDSIWQ